MMLRNVLGCAAALAIALSAAPASAAPGNPDEARLDGALRQDDETVVRTEEDRTFMGTVARNTFYGALTGGLIGGAIYLLDDDDADAVNIAYWAAGGALVGAGVGLVQLLSEEAEEAALRGDPYASVNPAPTFTVQALQLRF